MAFAGYAFTIDTSSFDELVRDDRRLEKMAQSEIRIGAIRSANKGMVEARKHAPMLRGSLITNIQILPPRFTSGLDGSRVTTGIAVGGNLGVYPQVQEKGRKAFQIGPPIAAMESYIRIKIAQGLFDIGWVRDKKNPVRTAAFALSASIGRKGTPSHDYISRGALVLTANMIKELGNVCKNWARRFEAGGR